MHDRCNLGDGEPTHNPAVFARATLLPSSRLCARVHHDSQLPPRSSHHACLVQTIDPLHAAVATKPSIYCMLMSLPNNRCTGCCCRRQPQRSRSNDSPATEDAWRPRDGFNHNVPTPAPKGEFRNRKDAASWPGVPPAGQRGSVRNRLH